MQPRLAIRPRLALNSQSSCLHFLSTRINSEALLSLPPQEGLKILFLVTLKIKELVFRDPHRGPGTEMPACWGFRDKND